MQAPLTLIVELYEDTVAMRRQLEEGTSDDVLTADMLQRWLARGERVHQIQHWMHQTNAQDLPAEKRELLESSLQKLCQAMLPIGPLLARHQEDVLQGIQATVQRRHQAFAYQQVMVGTEPWDHGSA